MMVYSFQSLGLIYWVTYLLNHTLAANSVYLPRFTLLVINMGIDYHVGWVAGGMLKNEDRKNVA